MSSLPLKVVFGGAGFNGDKFKTEADIKPFFDVFDKQGVTTIDTAQLYGNSETYIGEVGAAKKYTLDTKWLGGWTPGSAEKKNIIKTAKESLEKTGAKKVRVAMFEDGRGTDTGNSSTSSTFMPPT